MAPLSRQLTLFFFYFLRKHLACVLLYYNLIFYFDLPNLLSSIPAKALPNVLPLTVLIIQCTSPVCTDQYYILSVTNTHCTNPKVILSRLFMSATFNNWISCTLVCRWSRPSWLRANLLTTSFTVSIPRSRWRLLFYVRALTMFLSTMFWNCCMIFLMLSLVQVQQLDTIIPK